MSFENDFRFLETNVIRADAIDWDEWLRPEDKARIIPAENFAEDCKRDLCLGTARNQGVTLPWPKLRDKVLIVPGKLALWTGWSHHGKSRMLKQFCNHAVTEKEKILICSMEEAPKDIWIDLCTMYTGTQDPSPSQIDKFVNHIRGHVWIYDQEGTVDPNRMVALCRYSSSMLNITQIIVDSLMMIDGRKDDYDKQVTFVRNLKSVAKDSEKSTIHLVAHMRKRDSKTSSGPAKPGTDHDIAGGHELYSLADYVFSVFRDKTLNSVYPCLFEVMKQRGRTDWIGVAGLGYCKVSRNFIETTDPVKLEPEYKGTYHDEF